MDRLKGVASLAVTAALFLLALRLLHLTVPALYPAVLSGPFSLDDLGQVKEYAGFSPLVPFYRPIALGARPVNITVVRRGRARVTVFWQAESFLVLNEVRGGSAPDAPPEARPLEGRPGTLWWQEGNTQHLSFQVGELRIDLRTDLPHRDLERLLLSLRPYEELL